MNGKWYDAAEHLPDAGRPVMGYSAIWGKYYLCCFNPYRGWVSLNEKEDIGTMTAWLDAELPLPYPITAEIDVERAKAIGLRVRE